MLETDEPGFRDEEFSNAYGFVTAGEYGNCGFYIQRFLLGDGQPLYGLSAGNGEARRWPGRGCSPPTRCPFEVCLFAESAIEEDRDLDAGAGICGGEGPEGCVLRDLLRRGPENRAFIIRPGIHVREGSYSPTRKTNQGISHIFRSTGVFTVPHKIFSQKTERNWRFHTLGG